MLNRISIDDGGERRVAQSLVILAQRCIVDLGVGEVIRHSSTTKGFLENAAEIISRNYPVCSHNHSLSEQLLFEMEAGETDCRLSATAMGLVMIASGVFDRVALVCKPGKGLHIGVVGQRDSEVFRVDFLDDQKGYSVRDYSVGQLIGKSVFDLNSKGILALDKAMNR